MFADDDDLDPLRDGCRRRIYLEHMRLRDVLECSSGGLRNRVERDTIVRNLEKNVDQTIPSEGWSHAGNSR